MAVVVSGGAGGQDSQCPGGLGSGDLTKLRLGQDPTKKPVLTLFGPQPNRELLAAAGRGMGTTNIVMHREVRGTLPGGLGQGLFLSKRPVWLHGEETQHSCSRTRQAVIQDLQRLCHISQGQYVLGTRNGRLLLDRAWCSGAI